MLSPLFVPCSNPRTDDLETSDQESNPLNEQEARERLDEQVREIMQWHFSPETGSPFWLQKAEELDFDPRKDVASFADLKQFPPFEDGWLRGGTGARRRATPARRR